MDSAKVVGLIAGEGRLPFMIAAGAKKAGVKVVCVGLDGSSEASLAGEVDIFYTVPLARPGNWIRKLKRHGVTNTVMVGRVAKGQIFTPWRILKYLPDWRAVRIWYWRLRKKNKQNETLLSALADELASGGIISGRFDEILQRAPGDKRADDRSTSPAQVVASDIEFGWPIVKKIAEMDIGQAIAVKEREVIAVEGIEGTADMIERAGRLCKKGGWTLLKAAKAKKDMRFDVPCVGPDTISSLAKNGAKCLVVEAGKTIIIDKPQTLELADQMGICVIGK